MDYQVDWKESLRKSIIAAIIGDDDQKLKAYYDVATAYRYTAPGSLYKYFPPMGERIRMISNNELWYSAPCKFNDAFDTAFSYDADSIFKCLVEQMIGSRNVRIGSFAWKQAQQAAKSAFKNFDAAFAHIRDTTGVACLSENADSRLMWAHYAGNHEGMCVEYRLMDFHKKLRFTPIPIIYSDQRPVLKTIDADNFESSVLPFFINCLSTKSTEWYYENEWRIVRDSGSCGAAWNAEKQGALLPSLKPLSITLGCEAHGVFEAEVQEYCKNHQVDLYKMEKDEKEYKLNRIPIMVYSESGE